MSSVKISNSANFVIQVMLEDADDNKDNKYGENIFFPALIVIEFHFFLNFQI